MSEIVDIVDKNDRVIGQASRQACHGDPSLIHRVVHIMVFNPLGDLLLQLRGRNKQIQPNKWDTSVGGHLSSGEGYEEGAKRELEEELGIQSTAFKKMYDYTWRSEIETERVRTYRLIHNGPVRFNKTEIEEALFWSPEEIDENLGNDLFTPNFEKEWSLYQAWKKE